jgi:hypothetical protein
LSQADGNLLQVYHKIGSAGKLSAPRTPAIPTGPREVITIEDRSDDSPRRGGSDRRGGLDRYTPRNDRRRDYGSRDDVVDGSYGFDERMDTDDNYGSGRDRGLYSDNMVGNRGHDSGRDRAPEGRGYDRGRVSR